MSVARIFGDGIMWAVIAGAVAVCLVLVAAGLLTDGADAARFVAV